MRPPPAAAEGIDRFVREHRRLAPGLLDRVIVTGSIALGDWHAGSSDIDLVMVARRPPVEYERQDLAALHASARPFVDGLVLMERGLGAGPDRLGTAAQVVEGVWRDGVPGGELTWVTWREIEQGVEGSATASGVDAWAPSRRRFPGAAEGARRFCRRNLVEYWQPLGRSVRAGLGGGALDGEAMQWIGLGPARLVATVKTGVILSKTAAGRFAAKRFPDTAG